MLRGSRQRGEVTEALPMTEDVDNREAIEGAMAFASAETTKSFKHGADVDACVSLASKIDQCLDVTLSGLKSRGVPIACKAGCSFCCYTERVTLGPHEAIALFRYLNSRLSPALREEIKARVLANAEQISKMTAAERPVANIKCAFLVNDQCSAYEVRPFVCAGHHSTDRAACEASFNNPTDLSPGIPMIDLPKIIQGGLIMGIREGYEELGLTVQQLELHIAVAALLKDPTLIAKWRSGRKLVKDPSAESP